MRTVLWTEIREALVKDFGTSIKVPRVCPPNLEAVIISNADYISELVEERNGGKPNAEQTGG